MVTHYIHRGLAKKSLKENTITSFRYSFKKNFGIETDIHTTKDNQIVCFHDFNIKNKFKINKKIKDLTYSNLKKISKKKKAKIPLLKDLIKICKNKYPLLIEIKPFLNQNHLENLLKVLKKNTKHKIISFKEKNLIKLYQLNKKLSLGLLMLSNTSIKKIKLKSKLNHINFLVLDKSFLQNKKTNQVKKPIYYYTIKNKNLFNKYKNSKNLIFENL